MSELFTFSEVITNIIITGGQMTKETKEKLKINIVIGALCFALGAVVFSDSKTVTTLKQENSNLVSEYESKLAKKDAKIDELQSKVDEAKPWFDKQEKEQKAEQAKKEAEEKAKKDAEEKAKKKAEEQANKEAEAKGVNTDDVKERVNSIIEQELGDPVSSTTLESLNVNENLGTDSNKDVVVLANLSWSRKNYEGTTRQMLKMYSDNLAATLAPELADGSEIALFWHADYTGLDIKHSYYIENGTAYMQ